MQKQQEIKIQGQIVHIGEPQPYGKDFSMKQIIVLTNEEKPQPVPIYFLKEKKLLISSYKVGENVNVSVNIKAVKGQGYVSLTGWKISNIQPPYFHEGVKND